ncbi:MAG: ATP-dependent Clp protease proteolytic subunit [Lentisphaeraceae bacterium]|nr:ATP-dependent Clp protease proteolytic subunit [Lentisphaeraceae bacterium]
MAFGNYNIPGVIEQTAQGEKGYDLYTRLLKDRIIFLCSEVNDAVASSIVAQLLFLQAEDPKKDIQFFVNSPGGSVTAGLAIYDTMQVLSCDIQTTCIGQAASMGAVLLAAGTAGKRFCLPHSRIMIHQPWGGAQGTASDINIQAGEIKRLKKILNGILAHHTGKDLSIIEKDSDRDFFMDGSEAVEYGMVDKIMEKKQVK